MPPRRLVLVTRPEPGLSETMRAVAALGFEPLAAPMLRIEPLRPSVPKRVQAVLFTSGQAVAPLVEAGPWLSGTPVLTVGDATAARAREAGFASVASAGRDAQALAALARQTLDPAAGTLLLACGRGQGTELARALRQSGFSVLRRSLYHAVQAGTVPDAAIAAARAGRVDAALFFSGDTAAAFEHAWPGDVPLTATDALVISPYAAARLTCARWRRVVLATRPDAVAMMALLSR